MRVPTTEVVGADGGKLIINTSDYDANVHKLFVPGAEEPQPPAGVTPAAFTPAPASTTDTNGNVVNPGDGGASTVPLETKPQAELRFVSKDAKTKKFFVVNDKGERVQADGVSQEGYATEADAWAAINAKTA